MKRNGDEPHMHPDELEIQELESRFARGELDVEGLKTQLTGLFARSAATTSAMPMTVSAGGRANRMEPIVVTLQRGKETKGTHRFEAGDMADVPISTVYIKKSAFAGGKVPKAVRLTVEVAEDGQSS